MRMFAMRCSLLAVALVELAEAGRAETPRGARLSRLDFRMAGGAQLEVTESVSASIHLEDPDSGVLRSQALLPGSQAPAGTWLWHAEGPGWITVGMAPERITGSGALPLSAQAVPSCRASLGHEEIWRSIDRIEILSEDWGTSYAVDPHQRREFEVPKGRFGLVFRSASGVVGLAAPLQCDGGTPYSVEPPSTPQPGYESTYLRLRTPSSGGSGAALEVVLRELGTAPVRAITEDVLRVETKDSVAMLFVNRKSRPVEILVTGNDVKSLRELLPEQDRAVREVSLQAYPRAVLALETDFRPARPHRLVELSLLRCHDAPLDAYAIGQLVGRGECETIATLPLRVGLVPQRFERLDQGTYVFAAQVDEEWISSEEFSIAPVIAPADEEVSVPKAWILEEMEIFGQILQSGRPVPGVVRVSGHLEDHRIYQEFPTDEDLVYHWTFTGRPFRHRGDYPWQEELAHAKEAERLSTEPWARVQACAGEGGCFVAASEAYFVGGGRFDIDLPDTAPLTLEVLDAETEAPIPEAKIVVTGRRFNLAFHKGMVRRLDAPGFRDELLADLAGRATVRFPEEPSLEVIVGKTGYEPQRFDLAAARAAASEEHIVHLRPKSDAPRGTTILDAKGKSVAGAQVVVLAREEEQIQVRCSAAADYRGVVEVPESCQLDRALAVLIVHRSLGTVLASPSDLADQAEFKSGQGPRHLVVQVRHPDGSPVAARSVRLGIEGSPLPAELYWLMRSEGRVPRLTTNDEGEISLPFLSGENAWSLAIAEEDGRGFSDLQPIVTNGSKRALQVLLFGN